MTKPNHISEKEKVRRTLYRVINRDKIQARNREYMKEYTISHKSQTREWQYNTPKGMTTKWWRSLNRRTINGSHPQWTKSNRCYLLKGVELRINREQLYALVILNWPKIQEIKAIGQTPSIDRVGPSIHYELGNIQFISLKENALKGAQTTSLKFKMAREA